MTSSRSFVLLLLLQATSAFQGAPTTRSSTSTILFSAAEESSETAPITMESVLRENYPEYHKLLSKNEKLLQELEGDNKNGFTLFAPSSAAFQALGEKKLAQLEDPRNLETAQKMGLCHVIPAETLSFTDLNREDWTVPKTPEGLPALKYGALLTLGGEVPIGRTKMKSDGNFFQNLIGGGEVELDENGKPKTNIIVGPEGKIVRSLKIGNAVIHEVDSLVSPIILWRYCDQLRIPGF